MIFFSPPNKLCMDDGVDTEHCRRLLFPICGYSEDRRAQRKTQRERMKKTRKTDELYKLRVETLHERLSSCSSEIFWLIEIYLYRLLNRKVSVQIKRISICFSYWYYYFMYFQVGKSYKVDDSLGIPWKIPILVWCAAWKSRLENEFQRHVIFDFVIARVQKNTFHELLNG